jgi:hypothetical protein
MNAEALKEHLMEIAKKKAWSDNKEFMVDDYAGGNIDDAYYGGASDGEVLLAREILEEFFEVTVGECTWPIK